MAVLRRDGNISSPGYILGKSIEMHIALKRLAVANPDFRVYV